MYISCINRYAAVNRVLALRRRRRRCNTHCVQHTYIIQVAGESETGFFKMAQSIAKVSLSRETTIKVLTPSALCRITLLCVRLWESRSATSFPFLLLFPLYIFFSSCFFFFFFWRIHSYFENTLSSYVFGARASKITYIIYRYIYV